MALKAGTLLGPYEIVELIGAGGMGEVYRAHDARVGRDVAVKVSAAQFSERFEREARAVAALNHPNICTLYDVGPNYLVMEYIEGEAPKGPLPLEESLRIARQIADALGEAHDKGVVHRDLKPGNIKIRPDGSVKVLDFGLAKVAPASSSEIDENSPTISMAATQAGVILGTAAYMAPEQARGKPTDRRADIWAFGVVLYELLTGRRLFQGEDVTETLAAVVMKQPDLSGVPPRVRPLLAKCLEKDPRRRLQAIGDMGLLLDGEPQPETISRPAKRLLPWAVAALFVLTSAVLAFFHFREVPPPELVLKYTVALPDATQVHSFAVSPDGRYVVIAANTGGKRQLWLRALDTLQGQPLPFTDDATYPFWSPDSAHIGFFAQGSLKKVAASGGPSQSLCPVPAGRGGSWNSDDVIIFSPSNGSIAIQRVPAGGGVPADIGVTKGNFKHPVFLPDGRHFLYMSAGGIPEKNGIYFSSLDGKENRRVLADISGAVYAPPPTGTGAGHILFIRDGTLMAQPFDAARGQTVGDVFPVADGVSLTSNGSYAPASVSDNGVLLYAVSGGGTGYQIGWFDRGGKALGPVSAPGNVREPALSPDEKFVAFSRRNGTFRDLQIRDLNRGTDTRFTSDASLNLQPFWSPRGDRIVFASNRKDANFNLYEKATSGNGQDEPLLETANSRYPSQWSTDGRFIVYWENDPKNRRDIWVLPVSTDKNDRKPILAVQTEFEDYHGQLSPDGHWMAFTSELSGPREVYVRPFPPADGQWKISLSGGQGPRWKGDGREIYFEAADGKLMAAPVKALAGPKPSFEPETPVALFDAHMVHDGADVFFEYDVTADGKRFLINTTGSPGAASAPPLTIWVNWNDRSKPRPK